jgi:hypothetical protein
MAHLSELVVFANKKLSERYAAIDNDVAAE